MVRTTAQPLEAVPWWAGNARLTNLSGKLLGAMDASAVCLVWVRWRVVGFIATLFVSVNITVYPEVFYGPTLVIRQNIIPYFASPDPDFLSARSWLANAHYCSKCPNVTANG